MIFIFPWFGSKIIHEVFVVKQISVVYRKKKAQIRCIENLGVKRMEHLSVNPCETSPQPFLIVISPSKSDLVFCWVVEIKSSNKHLVNICIYIVGKLKNPVCAKCPVNWRMI